MILDHPINNPDQDVLYRETLAKEFSEDIQSLPCDQGAVVAVMGPWGSGKTSFLNLFRNIIEESGYTVLEFNPWMFSGASELVDRFFLEICQQLKRKRLNAMKQLGEVFEEYMGTLPGYVGGASKMLGKLLKSLEHRAKIEESLGKLDKPVIVLIDDIDRLSPNEMRDIFRLVRLTCQLPNVLYVLAFDRHRAELALEEGGLRGRDYLEKIVQWSVDLPEIPEILIREAVIEAIRTDIDGHVSQREMDKDAWINVFNDIVLPLIKNMRDVRRYAIAVRPTTRALAKDIQLADILGLEAIRIFLPDVFRQIHPLARSLTIPAESKHDDATYRKELEELIKAGGKQPVLEATLEHLFPLTEKYLSNSRYGNEWQTVWLKERRVAHYDVLSLYLERFENDSMKAIRHAEDAFSLMADGGAFDKYLRSIDQNEIEDVIRYLGHFEDEFALDHVVPGVTVLLNYVHELPERQRDLFERDGKQKVASVVRRLIKLLSGADHAESLVSEILAGIRMLGSRLDLILWVGQRESIGARIVTEEYGRRLERQWRDEVRQTPVGCLVDEPELLSVLSGVESQREKSEPGIELEFTPSLTIALLRNARDEIRHTKGLAIEYENTLAWDQLTQLYGDEAKLVRSIEKLEAEGADLELVELARRYADGWRPDTL